MVQKEMEFPDSDAINKAIDVAASAGGSTVYFPPGNYASYSIDCCKNVRVSNCLVNSPFRSSGPII